MNLKLADVPLRDVIAHFAAAGVEAGYLVPTATGLGHSILDAHSPLRDYLRRKGIHDYALQAKGQEAKKEVPAFIVLKDRLVESRATLYRPESKDGDPRIWFKHLPAHVTARNVLAVLAHEGQLYVVNASDAALLATGADASTPLGRILSRERPAENPAAQELLAKVRTVASRGFIRTMRPGPTGIGYTLETMLGIPANSRRAPDFKGIEIKAGRATDRGEAATRGTLFSCVPSWKTSAMSHPRMVLDEYGYEVDGRRQLYCSLNDKPNTLGLYLGVDAAASTLHVRHSAGSGSARDVVSWSMDRLHERLAAKHRETFWIKAKTRGSGEDEAFQFVAVEHTLAAIPSNFGPMIDSGVVEFDFTLSLIPTKAGGLRVRDHGYLFKLWEQDRALLFPPARRYALA